MATKNFVSNANVTILMNAIAAKFTQIGSVLVPKGTTTFASLPAVLTSANLGWFYNVSNAFTTDTRFVEGAGKKYPEGTNVYVVDLSTTDYTAVTPVGNENPQEEGWYEESGGVYTPTFDTTVVGGKTYYEATVTPIFKYDIMGGYIDLQAIYDLITGAFDETVNYTVGDVVLYNGKLYECTTDYSAGTWDANDFTEKTIIELIDEAEPDELTTAQMTALLAILNN